MKKRYALLSTIFMILGLLWVYPVYAKEGKKPKEPPPPLKITILTLELGKEPSFTVPSDLAEFWKIMDIQRDESVIRLIPNVRCLRIDLDEETEFKIKRPDDSFFVKARKLIGTWSDENERIHLISEIEKQQIGELFSSKKPSTKTSEQVSQIACKYSKELQPDKILIYDSNENKKQHDKNKESKIGNSDCVGIFFTNLSSLMDYLKSRITSDMKEGIPLNYLIAYKLNRTGSPIPVPPVESDKPPISGVNEYHHIGYGSHGFTYKDVQDWLKKFERDGWRLPSIEEMKSIKPDSEFLNDKAYWTKDKALNGNSYGFCFGANNTRCKGLQYEEFDETDSLAVIVVR